MSDRAARELRAETTLDAPPERVWEELIELRHMAEWSPEVVGMMPLKPGGLKVGQQYLGLNRRKAVIWPTRSVIAVVDPGRSLAWDTRSSGARWIYELEPAGEGTRVVHRRPVPRRITWISRAFTPVFLGGSDEHADELEHGMSRTLERLKAAVEG
jgi:uncharacterized protein YndB with AHSA1/START domain